MPVLNKISGRDNGDISAPATAQRRKTYDLRVAAHGTADGLNSASGIAPAHPGNTPDIHAMLVRADGLRLPGQSR